MGYQEYGAEWQRGVGWLSNRVENQVPEPLMQTARKIAYHMTLAAQGKMYVPRCYNREDISTGRFYHVDGRMGWHFCDIDGCNETLSGVFGFEDWVFPSGIVHYMAVHNYQPPQEFLEALDKLEDPPENVEYPPWIKADL